MTSADGGRPPFLSRVEVTNYRSIARCDVRLGPLTVLAGPNAAGKSNFLDALMFVRDALRSSPAHALESRGGLQEVLHRNRSGHAADVFRIRVEAHLPAQDRNGGTAVDMAYILEVGSGGEERPGGDRVVGSHLHLEVAGDTSVAWREAFVPADGTHEPTTEAREALVRSLVFLRSYELLTPVLRAVDDTPNMDRGNTLGERGHHLARVLDALARRYPWAKETIDGYLSSMIDNAAGLDGVEVVEGDLAFVVGRFLAENGPATKVDRRSLSEGTLRLAGVLAALFQPSVLVGGMRLVSIEEPEISLHPPMVGALYDALLAASRNTQVIVTTQSADLLDNAAADPAHVLVARDDGDGTRIGPIDASGRALMADGVLSLPELLRSGEMRPATTPDEPRGADGRA
ncbi:hypothetical protein N566_18290 [Streptomycetaceae bacterium MP113-05]|nr:hypothetical protein N566_18290 [Streptomycetaceae bacterium MP113-05]